MIPMHSLWNRSARGFQTEHWWPGRIHANDAPVCYLNDSPHSNEWPPAEMPLTAFRKKKEAIPFLACRFGRMSGLRGVLCVRLVCTFSCSRGKGAVIIYGRPFRRSALSLQLYGAWKWTRTGKDDKKPTFVESTWVEATYGILCRVSSSCMPHSFDIKSTATEWRI